MHPGKTCRIFVNDEDMGLVGELHPQALAELKIKRGVACFEIDLIRLSSQTKRVKAEPLSHFPPMARDVAFLADDALDAGPICAALQKACGELATDVQLFDVYKGKGIEAGKKSLAFSVQYRSFTKTLTDEEIDAIHNSAVKQVCSQFFIATR